MTRLASFPTSRDPTLVSIPRISAADKVTPVMRERAVNCYDDSAGHLTLKYTTEHSWKPEPIIVKV